MADVGFNFCFKYFFLGAECLISLAEELAIEIDFGVGVIIFLRSDEVIEDNKEVIVFEILGVELRIKDGWIEMELEGLEEEEVFFFPILGLILRVWD